MAGKSLSKAEVAKYLLRLRKASESFEDFVRLIYPDWELPDFQLELIRSLDKLEKDELDCDNLLITMPPRHAKALALDTPIPTPSGFTPMGGLKTGDTVFHPSGAPQKVTATSPVFFGNKCYKVRVSDGSEVIADADHLWTVRLCRKRNVWREMTTEEIYNRAQANPNARAPRLPEFNATQNKALELPIPPYTLGLWLGDGSTSSSRISVSTEDRSHAISMVESDGFKTSTTESGKRKLYFTPLGLQPQLRAEGLLDNKRIPEQYLIASVDQRIRLVKGMMDSDGTVSKAGQAFFCTTKKTTATGFRRLLWSLGIRNTLSTGPARLYGKDCGESYRVSFYSHDCFSLPRKRERCANETSRCFGRYIVDLTEVESTPTRCITVESEDGLYLAGEGHIPTHNSTFSTVLFPSYFMARNPYRYIMSCSYNAELAKDFGRQIRTIVEQSSVTQAFPEFKLSMESRAADTWRTESGGAYFAVGVGGTTSGRPANLLILDDPLKSREEAESVTQRNKSWNYYASALSTRLQPQPDGSKPKQLVILTRWHPDDIAGRLMATEDWKEGRWKHINFQAIQKTKAYKKQRKDLPEDDPRYLPPEVFHRTSSTQRDTWTYKEHSLWPERFPLEDLKRRQRLNPREFAALYQQEPYIQGGNLIKTEWWGNYPKDLSPENFVTLVIAVDTAFKKTEQADYSVACVAGLDRNGDIYIVDIIRGRYDFPELKQRLIRLNNTWRGRGLRAMYIEDKASGQSLIQELKRESGMAIVPYKVVADKVARVNAVLPIIEGGRVFVPEESPWLDDFIEETVTFPNGMHDDQVDAAIMAIDVLSRTSVSPEQYALQADPMQSLNNNKADFGKSLFKNVAGKARSWKGWGL